MILPVPVIGKNPEPVIGKESGLVAVLLVTEILALRAPRANGLKATLIVQVALGASVAPQVVAMI